MFAALLAIALAGGPAVRQVGPSRAFIFPLAGGTPLSYALPTSGSACACPSSVALVGPVPATLAVTRASSAYCYKGDWFAPAVGDMVLCSANQLRLMPGGDGGGDLGVFVEESSTNGAVSSEAFNSASWVPAQDSAPRAPTITANAALSPDGTMDAERVQFVATSGSQFSGLNQSDACAASSFDTFSLFVKSHDGVSTGTLDLVIVNASVPVSFTGSWTRVVDPVVLVGGAKGLISFGNWSLINGNLSRPAIDIDVWGAQCEVSSATVPLTSYIPNSSGDAGATRAADVVEAPVLFDMLGDLTLKSSLVSEVPLITGNWTVAEGNQHDGANWFEMERAGNTLLCDSTAGSVHSTVTSVATFGITGADALKCTYDGFSQLTDCVNSTCVDAGVSSTPSAIGKLTVGAHWNGFSYVQTIDGVVKDLVLSQSSKKNIEIFGDSTAEGHTAGVGHYPQDLIQAKLGTKVAVNNLATSGNTTLQVRTTWENELATVITYGTASRTYWVLQAGINDQPDAGGAIGNLEAMLLEAQDAGVHVMWSTVTPDSVAASYVSAIDSTLTTFCAAHNITQADTFSALQDPNNAGAYNPIYNYNSDGLHPNDAGVEVTVDVWIPAGGWR